MQEAPQPTRQIKTFSRPVTYREAVEAFKRLKPVREGQQEIIRFSLGQRIEHFVLMTTVGILAVTGFAQTFDYLDLGRQFLRFLGGLEAAQRIHHLFALVLCGLAIFHTLDILDRYFVRRQTGKLLPEKRDLELFFQFLTLKKLPLFERYTFDEKFVYWVTVIAVGVLSITGLGLWFPTWVSVVLPGSYFPYAVVIHRWQAIFVVTVLLSLHTYQVLLRKRNFSIFTGRISIEDMQEDHPVELAYLEQVATLAQSEDLPKAVEFSIEEHSPKEVVIVINTEPEELDEDEQEETDEAGQPEAVENKTTIHLADGESAQ